MKGELFEIHTQIDADFPVIFHLDILTEETYLYWCISNWHRNIEILYFIEGGAEVVINTEKFYAKEGDIIVIPSNALHIVNYIGVETKYYCLIVDHRFCSKFGFDDENFKIQIRDNILCEKMEKIVFEFEEKKKKYKSEIMSEIISLLVFLSRNYCTEASVISNEEKHSKTAMVKKAIKHMEENMANELSIDELSEKVGFNKFYFCHTFKEMTQMTPIAYFNFMRCIRAKELLSTKKCTVSEAAFECGFSNLSYFTKTYKKYLKELPSESKK